MVWLLKQQCRVCELLLFVIAQVLTKYSLLSSDHLGFALGRLVASLLYFALDYRSEEPDSLVEAVGFVATPFEPQQIAWRQT